MQNDERVQIRNNPPSVMYLCTYATGNKQRLLTKAIGARGMIRENGTKFSCTANGKRRGEFRTQTRDMH